MPEKQKSHEITQRSLNKQISQLNDRVKEQDRKLREQEANFEALRSENDSLT